MKVLLAVAFMLMQSVISLILGVNVSALNANIPIELDITSTSITLQGRASPNAIIIIEQSGDVIASFNSNLQGVFSKTIAVRSGINNFNIYYKDSTGLQSKKIRRSISAQSQQNTVETLYLPPTVTRTNKGPIKLGSIIQIRGSTIPDAVVELRIDFGKYTYTAKSDSIGRYEFLIDSSVVGLRTHRAVVFSQKNASDSEVSEEISFVIVDDAVSSVPDLVTQPDNLPPPIPLLPENGAVIEGESVIIAGESIPNAQINVYQGNTILASFFADESGDWSFEYTATTTPVTLSFEACIDNTCSVFSKTITLNFDALSRCNIDFELAEYRFWDIVEEDPVILELLYPDDGLLTIDWGDGTEEVFNIRKDSEGQFSKRYAEKGIYNGVVVFDNGDCQKKGFFSVSVVGANSNNVLALWIVVVVLVVLLFYEFSRKKKRTS